jgi:hypothetical protein
VKQTFWRILLASNPRDKASPLHSTHPSPTSLRGRNYRRSLDLPARLPAILDLLLFFFCRKGARFAFLFCLCRKVNWLSFHVDRFLGASTRSQRPQETTFTRQASVIRARTHATNTSVALYFRNNHFPIT